MRLVDADKMKADLLTVDPQFETMIHWCITVLDAQPTIEPERKKGQWFRTGRENIYGGFEVECSVCGDKVMITHIEDELFCRHCGAKMEGWNG